VSKHFIHILRYLSLSLGLAFVLLFAATLDAEASQGLINYDVVNIRSGPGTNYQIDGKILKNSQVTVLQTQGDWKKISFGKVTGWVAAQYINAIGIGDIVITGEWVNIRSGPGTNYTAIGKADKGESFTLLSQDGDWCHILTSSGQEGYVAGYLTQVKQPGNTGTAAAAVNSSAPSGSASSTNANSSSNIANIVSVFLDGKQLSFEVEPIIENGRTLVPLRAIFEAMGAVVGWDEKTRTVTASKGSDYVVLPLNSTSPNVNGEKYTLEVPAKIVNGRTLAPLRFVAEAFGGQVDWDQSNLKVAITTSTNISNSNSNVSGNYSTGRPAAVTAKIQDVSLREQPSGSANAMSVAHPGEALAVLDERDGWYQVSRGGTTAWVAAWLVEAASASDNPSGANGTGTINNSSGNPSVIEPADMVRLTKISNSEGIVITLSSDESFKPEVKESSGQIQYELGKLPVASFANLDESFADGKITIKKTVTGEDNTITITLPSWIEYELGSFNDKKYTLSIPNYISSITKTDFGSVGDRLIIHSLGPIKEQTGTLSGSDLVIKIPDVKIKPGYKFTSKGTLFNSLEMSESGKDVLLTIKTNDLGRYSFANSGSNKDLNIVLMKKMVRTGEKVVVLDPGHGGTDPGSSGTFLKEKDVNLAVALKVGALLQQRGIKVEYTRIDDTTMSLSEEVEVGNAINATAFVAIHCNSSTNVGPSGTETYFYAPLDVPELYIQREERSKLATLIQTNMISRLGLVDRGVKDHQPYYVLNHTNMPSALVEIGFINNLEEERLLAQEEIRDKAAYAIADAIQEWLQNL